MHTSVVLEKEYALYWIGPNGEKDVISMVCGNIPFEASKAATSIFHGMSAHAQMLLMRRMCTPIPAVAPIRTSSSVR